MRDWGETTRTVDAGAVLGELTALADDRSSATLDHIVRVAREVLGMDFAYIAAFDDGQQVHIAIDGDVDSFEAPGALPLEDTVCRRMVRGDAPNLISDARMHPAVADAASVTRYDIGAYIGVPVRYSEGRVFGTLCCLSHEAEPSLAERDVAFMTVLARLAGDYLEREEIVARQKLERAETLARVAHDLRSPLQAIIGYAELLQRDAVPEYAETVAAEAQRLNLMLDELLDSRRSFATTFDLREVVAEQARVFAQQSESHEIIVSDAAEAALVEADRARIASVVANLLSNAIKYSPAGHRVEVAVASRRGRARVSVRDYGVGIPESLQSSIFTRFFRATTSATDAIRGTGLGLAISRDVVRGQGGDAGFSSVEGEGSTFWFELPTAGGSIS